MAIGNIFQGLLVQILKSDFLGAKPRFPTCYLFGSGQIISPLYTNISKYMKKLKEYFAHGKCSINDNLKSISTELS